MNTLCLPPTQDSSHKWRFRLGFPAKNGILLVVTVCGWGVVPMNTYTSHNLEPTLLMAEIRRAPVEVERYFIPWSKVLAPSKVVVWDFWTINVVSQRHPTSTGVPPPARLRKPPRSWYRWSRARRVALAPGSQGRNGRLTFSNEGLIAILKENQWLISP